MRLGDFWVASDGCCARTLRTRARRIVGIADLPSPSSRSRSRSPARSSPPPRRTATPSRTRPPAGLLAPVGDVRHDRRSGQGPERHLRDEPVPRRAEPAAQRRQPRRGVRLIREADYVKPVTQGHGPLARTVYTDRTIGWDSGSEQFTNVYTVITSPRGDLITAFPGLPGKTARRP